MPVRLVSGCKVNLSLRVGERLPSGYHTLETLFLELPSPSDTMTIMPGAKGITVFCDHPAVDPGRNTLTKAFALYSEKRLLAAGIQVTLDKKVPVGAGLGGGSANAALLLNHLQSLPSLEGEAPLDDLALTEVAAAVGADVPFFLRGGCQKATGIGEKLHPCKNPFAGLYLVLVCPETAVSTGWAFNALDEKREFLKKNSSVFLTSSPHRVNTSSSRSESCQNDFEQVVFDAFPELAKIKDSLADAGAEVALLSGTGSSLFGIFANIDSAKKFMDKCRYNVYLHSL